MNLITRRPPEDSLGDAGALAPLSLPPPHSLFLFYAARRLRSTRPFPSSESCHLSRVSEASLLPLGKNKFRQRSNAQKPATSHKYHRRGKSAGRRRGKEKRELERRQRGGCGALSIRQLPLRSTCFLTGPARSRLEGQQ